MTQVRIVRQAPTLAKYCIWKLHLDRLLSAILLIPALPTIVILALIVRATSRGPGIFRQVRAGRQGKSFTMYKLRTMHIDAETAATGPVWAKINDPRTTLLGRWLRHTHLDELPQLFNVLKGEMALVGPRPERPEFVAILAKRIPEYLRRLEVTPGITGLAQINLPPDSDLESVQRKLFLDRAYIETMSFWLDLRLLFCTATKLVGIDGKWAAQILNLRRCVPSYANYNATDSQSTNTDESRCKVCDVSSHSSIAVSEPDSVSTIS